LSDLFVGGFKYLPGQKGIAELLCYPDGVIGTG
jgi:hypothetical protein